jgi:DUF1680 family protein
MTTRALPFSAVEIHAPFWRRRQRDTAEAALVAQWHNLEAAGTIDNFRIAAGQKHGPRRGLFFVDSDAHKWADAAARTLQFLDLPQVADHLDEYIDVVAAAQADDGYLFTFNQVHFRQRRWVNLQVEHELYCHGHLIEAGIAAAALPRHARLFAVATRAADLLVRHFAAATPAQTPGHPEVELALLRLADATGDARYAELAERFLEQRGRGRGFGFRLLREFASHGLRARSVLKRRHGAGRLDYDARETLHPGEGPGLLLRSLPQFFSGRYQQQQAPLRATREPVGHSVRWSYLAAAGARLARRNGDPVLHGSLAAAWTAMVTAHTYISGGVGALAIVEGFGRPYALGNASAYCETCAAIASVLWTREMHLGRPSAEFADLIEWQLHNAVACGSTLDGRRYFYRNPLESAQGMERRPWFHVACCPSNISRTWAALGELVVTATERDVWVDQYWSTGDIELAGVGPALRLRIDSDLPWHGRVAVEIDAAERVDAAVHLRIPGWSGPPSIRRDGEVMALELPRAESRPTASGYSPFGSYYVTLPGPWQGRARIELELPMEVRLHRADERVVDTRGKVALSRGPVVYCLEAVDHPGLAVPGAAIDLGAALALDVADDLDGCVTIGAQTPTGVPLRFVPYYAWANRAPGGMQIWVAAG